MISDFSWPEPENEADEKILSNVREYGCHVVRVFSETGNPEFAFSIGLFFNFGHPEVLIMGLPGETAHTLINDIRDKCSAGHQFLAGTRTDLLLKGLDVSFVDVSRGNYPDYLGFAMWFYQSLGDEFPVVQMVWPDRQGRFPWEHGYDVSFNRLQPILSD